MSVINVYRQKPADDAVNIMRPSKWSNPYRIEPGRTREECIALYRRHLWLKIVNGEIDLEELADLHGRELACCCEPRPCHGHVLERAAAWAHSELKISS